MYLNLYYCCAVSSRLHVQATNQIGLFSMGRLVGWFLDLFNKFLHNLTKRK